MPKQLPDRSAESSSSEFEEAFERYYPRVSRFFSRRGFSDEESQDLAQKTFLKVYRGWARHRRRAFETEGPDEPMDRYREARPSGDRETSWIFTIALNVYRNEVRHAKARKRDAAVAPLDPLRDKGWEPASLDGSPEEALAERQRVEMLEVALEALPPAMRRCFELRFAHGLKYREIASILQISIQSVRSQLHDARKRLEGLLSGR